ncbi:MAG: glycerophosphodiester phosphodiesterase family protein, partial [Myxococcales bacterium]|nr:glycerophosphodiester phosphodiesterase family protein [Myxococcales bacterium]
DVTEGSPFNECVEGRSTDPSCANPFTDFPPRAITAAQAAAGAEGTVYYNLYSADLPCETCTCKIWCDAPGQSQSAAHPDSDLFIAAENSRLPNAYNIEVERLAHWDFIQGDASQYTTALDWLARYGTARPRRNDTWAQTMQALVGRDPTQAPVGGPPAADCANPHVHATFGLGGGPSDPCAPARCGTLSASGPNGGGPANLVAIVGLILGAILLAKARARSSRGESAAIAAALLAALGASGCANSLTDQTRLDQCVLDPLCTRTLAVGHGGSPREAPENTVPGILAAWNSGADMVELDVRASADGALVLMRDSTVDRTTTGRGFVTDLTLEQLRGFEVHAVRAGGPTTTIPTLEEALDTVRGRMLCALEIRQADMARVIDALHARGAASACLLVTPSLPYAVLAKRMDPEIAVASWAYDWRGVNDLARATRTDVIFVPNRLDSREVVDLIRALGRKVATSLIGGPDLAGVASPGSVYGASVAFGTSMILTDFVPQVAAFLETRSPAIL